MITPCKCLDITPQPNRFNNSLQNLCYLKQHTYVICHKDKMWLHNNNNNNNNKDNMWRQVKNN
jgi:hypothetical protein